MKYSPFYRILVVLFVYALIGIMVFLPFANDPNINWVFFFIVLGVYLAALFGTIVFMEIGWARKYKKEDALKEQENVIEAEVEKEEEKKDA